MSSINTYTMKRIIKTGFLSVILAVGLTGVAVAQAAPKANNKTRVAVIEFTPGPNVPGISVEAKRQLQASIAFNLVKSNRFDVVDVRHTREASKADLGAVNGALADAAVRVGKQLGVSYVLTGTIDEYNSKGSATLQTRLVEVATGKVKHNGEISAQSNSAITTDGDAEMKTKVLKPLIIKLTAALQELVL
jgi:TolB-like protein